MSRAFLSVLILGLASTLTVEVARADVEAARAAQEARIEQKRIVAAVPRDFPPYYGLSEKGELEGFAIDILQEVARIAGFQVEFLAYDGWAGVFQAIEERRADVVPSLGITPGRQGRFLYTRPFASFPLRFFVRREDSRFQRLSDVHGVKVGAVKRVAGTEYLHDRSIYHLVEFERIEEAVIALLGSNVDAIAFPGPILEQLARRAGIDRRLRSLKPAVLEIPRAIGISLHVPELVAPLDAAVGKLMESPTFHEIAMRWFDGTRPVIDERALYWIISCLVLTIVIGFPVYRLIVLKRVNTRLKAEIEERRRTADALAASQKEKAELESRVRQAQKLEAIGTLAGGIAHDFNNILQGVHACLERLAADQGGEDKLPPPHPVVRAMRFTRRGRDLVKGILQFARQGEERLQTVDLGLVLMETVDLLHTVLPPGVNLVERIEGSAPLVKGVRSELQQVIMNLVTNAAHAMPDGGTVEVVVRPVVLDERESRRLGLMPGRFVCLEVQDRGTGIAPEIRERIFDPFFTSKPPGKGTGMGLAIVHGIVLSHRGSIEVLDRALGGTIFRLYLPESESPATSVAPQSERDESFDGARVLLVDDEQDFTAALASLLADDGHMVTTCHSGKEALEALNAAGERGFDLLITDNVMPDVTGIELAEAAQRIRGKLPVILVSGLVDQKTQERLAEVGVQKVLSKPFGVRELSRAISEVLG